MIRVWLMNCACLKDQAQYEYYYKEYQNRLSEERLEVLSGSHNAGRKAQVLGAGLLFCMLLEENGIDPREVDIRKGAHGKPFYRWKKENRELFINLTHTNDCVGIIGAAAPVGIDVERIREPRVQLAKRFFTEKEIDCITQCDLKVQAETFFRLWTLKEAFLKTTGHGLTRALDSFDVTSAIQMGTLAVENICLRSEVWGEYAVSYGVSSKKENALQIERKHLDLPDKLI